MLVVKCIFPFHTTSLTRVTTPGRIADWPYSPLKVPTHHPQRQLSLWLLSCIPWDSHPTQGISGCKLQMHGNCSTEQRLGNCRNLMECDQKLIRPEEACNELVHRNWTQSNQQSVCKCAKTAKPIRGQETGNSPDQDKKLITPAWVYHNECIHQVWDRSPELFVRKYTETSQPIRGQEMVKIQTLRYNCWNFLFFVRTSKTNFFLWLNESINLREL